MAREKVLYAKLSTEEYFLMGISTAHERVIHKQCG
jgi:hypothetical protein